MCAPAVEDNVKAVRARQRAASAGPTERAAVDMVRYRCGLRGHMVRTCLCKCGGCAVVQSLQKQHTPRHNLQKETPPGCNMEDQAVVQAATAGRTTVTFKKGEDIMVHKDGKKCPIHVHDRLYYLHTVPDGCDNRRV